MKHRLLFFVLLLSSFLSLNAQNGAERLFAPPLLLDNVSNEMRNPGFWIARHPYPDSLLMTPKQIDAFNASIRSRRGSVAYMQNMIGSIAGSTVRGSIENSWRAVTQLRLWDSRGERVPASYWTPLRANCNLPSIPRSVKIRNGFPVRFASQRLAPTLDNLNKKLLDVEFDEVQNSGYDIGVPHVFYHTSLDGQWVYGSSALTSGWYRVEDVCFVDAKEWQDYQTAPDFAVVTAARADIWNDAKATKWSGFARMGTKLPISGETDAYYIIRLPYRENGEMGIRDGYLLKADANRGFLPYTPRNVYTLAFRMLGRPYGWADMNGDTDCSSFIKQLFACFGIQLPRNSAEQEKSGRIVHSFSSGENKQKREETVIKKAIPAITVLRKPGHITLYLGHVNGKGYVIHNTWAERRWNDAKKDEIYVVHSVVVSDLHVNQFSSLGALISNITAISILDN